MVAVTLSQTERLSSYSTELELRSLLSDYNDTTLVYTQYASNNSTHASEISSSIIKTESGSRVKKNIHLSSRASLKTPTVYIGKVWPVSHGWF